MVSISGTDIDTITLLPFFSIILTYLLFHKRNQKQIVLLISITLLSAFAANLINFVSAIALIGFATLSHYFRQQDAGIKKSLAAISIFLLSCLFMLHLVPGVTNPMLIYPQQISQDGVIFSKNLNIDKAFVGLVLFLYIIPNATKVNYHQNLMCILVSTLAISATLLIAVMIGFINFEPKLPTILAPWLISTLFFTCYSEQAFFRGVIQNGVLHLAKKLTYKNELAIVISGLLFGLVHFSAGPIYTLLAMLLGCTYAYVYYKSNSIYWPIAIHFSFNLIHITLFTYPYIQQELL